MTTLSLQDIEILRIKINGKSLIKLSTQHHKRDFLISYPLCFTEKAQTQSHFTFHTPNGRLTLKITSIVENGKEVLPQILIKYKNYPIWRDKINLSDLDLYGKKILNLDDSKKMYYGGTIALNLENSRVEKYFHDAKTPDSKFKTVKDIIIPDGKKNCVSIKFCFGKNYCGDLSEIAKKHNDKIIVQERNFAGNIYTVAFFIKYDFPDLSKKQKAKPSDF